MALGTTTQHAETTATPSPNAQPSNDLADALFGAVLLSVYGAQMSKKTVRKLKRKFFWTSLKLKFKSFFSKKRDLTDRQIIYLIAGAVFIILLFTSWVAALVLALIALVLILAGIIQL